MLCCDCRCLLANIGGASAGDLTGNFRIEFHARLLWLFAAVADDDASNTSAIPYIKEKEREFTNARIQFMN